MAVTGRKAATEQRIRPQEGAELVDRALSPNSNRREGGRTASECIVICPSLTLADGSG